MSLIESLTRRQRDVFDFIRDTINDRGYGPTVREIGDAFGINSPNGVMGHLKALEKKGLISREHNRSRAIRLAPEAVEQSLGLPLAGRVAAGVMHEAVEQDERIDFGRMFNDPDVFVLDVHGDSMIEAQIAEGDYVIVRRQKTATRGQMVVAQTNDGEATLKYWYPEKRRIRLQPANSSMSPMYSKNAKVLGVVVGVVRNMR